MHRHTLSRAAFVGGYHWRCTLSMYSRAMRLAVVPIPSTRPESSLFTSDNLPALFEFARVAEERGVDDLGLSEHIVMVHRPGKYGPTTAPHHFDEPWPEPLTTLAALAPLEVSCLLLARGRPLAQAFEEDVPRLVRAGATHLRVQASMFCHSLEAVPEFLDDLVARLRTL